MRQEQSFGILYNKNSSGWIVWIKSRNFTDLQYKAQNYRSTKTGSLTGLSWSPTELSSHGGGKHALPPAPVALRLLSSLLPWQCLN